MAPLETGEWITPQEAFEYAARYRAAAAEMREIAHRALNVGHRLDDSWFGNAKNIFDSHFNSFPQEIFAYADSLENMAQQISRIEVWVERNSNQ